MTIPKELAKRVYTNHYVNLIQKNRVKRYMSLNLIIDIIILIVHPIPFLDFGINYSEYMRGDDGKVDK